MSRFKLHRIMTRTGEPSQHRVRLASHELKMAGYWPRPSIWVPTHWKRRGTAWKPMWRSL